MSAFGKVCKRIKMGVNVGKNKIIRCLRFGNVGRMDVRLNCEQFDEVDCFKYLGCKWQ